MIQYKQTEKGREILRVLFGVEYFGYMNERDLKFIEGIKEEGFIYIPQFKEFVVLRIKSRFER